MIFPSSNQIGSMKAHAHTPVLNQSPDIVRLHLLSDLGHSREEARAGRLPGSFVYHTVEEIHQLKTVVYPI